MDYIIMADGKMTRWKNECSTPKHLIEIGGETLLQRLVRQLKAADCSCRIIITSHNPDYEVAGAIRYEPRNNRIELDRFTAELIRDDICFLYGDTYYSDQAIATITGELPDEALHFAGNEKSIIAVAVRDGEMLKKHIASVREKYNAGILQNCKGWQVYESYAGVSQKDVRQGKSFTFIDDETQGFNTFAEYERFRREHSNGCI